MSLEGSFHPFMGNPVSVIRRQTRQTALLYVRLRIRFARSARAV